jgi:uncharacterized membrane protein YhaH (DUF805 family)
MKWFIKCLRQYAVFSGRARRKEYWMFTLFYLLFAVLAMILDYIFGLEFLNDGSGSVGYGPIYIIYLLAMILPGLAVAVRRLHDTGRSGWHYFIVLIPLVGSIILLSYLLGDSKPRNEYGENPKDSRNELEY